MNRNTQAGLSTLLLILAVIGLSTESGGVPGAVASVFALVVGIMGAHNAITK